MLTFAPLPLVRDSAAPAYDQAGDFEFGLTQNIGPRLGAIWADSSNWSDEALAGLGADVTHLTLQRSTLTHAVIDTMLRLNKLTTLELVNVDIPPELDGELHFALTATAVEAIYYTGLFPPKWMHAHEEAVPAKVYMKIGSYGHDHCFDAPNLQCLDARQGLSLADVNDMSLVSGDRMLDTLLCRSENSEKAGKALAHLRVRHLTLTGDAFGDASALGLAWNTRIASVTLVDVPLKRNWVHQILRMSNIHALTIVRPLPFQTTVSNHLLPICELPVDQEFLSKLSRGDHVTITLKEHL